MNGHVSASWASQLVLYNAVSEVGGMFVHYLLMFCLGCGTVSKQHNTHISAVAGSAGATTICQLVDASWCEATSAGEGTCCCSAANHCSSPKYSHTTRNSSTYSVVWQSESIFVHVSLSFCKFVERVVFPFPILACQWSNSATLPSVKLKQCKWLKIITFNTHFKLTVPCKRCFELIKIWTWIQGIKIATKRMSPLVVSHWSLVVSGKGVNLFFVVMNDLP